MKIKYILVALLLISIPVVAQVETAEELTLDKVVDLSKSGLSTETIINTIISSKASFNLQVKDVLYLKENGVDEEVINFMLRTRPVEAAPQQVEAEHENDTVMAEEPETAEEPLPAYVADAAEGNYYDGYEYTDGYNVYDDRYESIIYHYYGPWFRSYPYYFGFYYYPASHYYYCYWPDDYYYYFYYPHFSSWRHYYYYPTWRYYPGHRYYYRTGGRYIRAPHRRYIYDADRKAIPRSANPSSRGSVRSRGSSVSAPYRSVMPSERTKSAISRSRYTGGTRTSSRISTPKRSVPSRSTIRSSQPTVTKRYSTPRRSTDPSYSRPSSSSKPSYSKPSSSRSRSRSYSSPSRPSSSRKATSRSSSSRSSSSRSKKH